MRSKLTLALSAAAVALGLGAWSLHFARAPQRRLAHELERIEASPAWQPRAPSPLAERVQAELREARDLFEFQVEPGHEHPPAVTTMLWGLETSAELEEARAFLERARPFVLRLERTLTDPAVQAAMDRGERLANEHTKLFLTRMHVNVLCVAAVVNARDGLGQRAGELLALARDYAYAVDGRGSISTMIRSALQSIVRGQIVRVLGLGGVDAVDLRRRLEPRLRRTFDERYREEQVRRQLQLTLEAVREDGALKAPSRAESAFMLEILFAGEDELTRARLAPSHYLIEWAGSPASVSAPWSSALLVMHERLAEDALLRIQLAAHAYRQMHGVWPAELGALASLFPEGVPLDPHTAQPFAVERHGDELRIGPAAISAEYSLSWERAEERGFALTLR